MSSETTNSTMKQEAMTALVPKLRFPEFRGEEEWGNAILGDLSQVVRGGSPRPIDGFLTTAANGLNWLKIGDVDKEAKYVTDTAEKVRPEALSKTRVVNPGDLILSNSMSFGRPYILQIRTCIHDGWIAITDIAKKADRDFLYYLISAPISQIYFVDNAAGSGVQNLNVDIIKALPVCYPSPAEQQKIADCLSSLDELIAAQAQKVEALKIHKKGLMQQLFPREGKTQPPLRFLEFQSAGEWEEKRLNQMVCFQSGGTPSKANSDYWGGSVPWVSAKDMKQLLLNDAQDRISTEAIAQGAKLAPSGALLMLVRGMTLLKDVPICMTCREMSFNQDVKALLPVVGVDGLFLALMLTSSMKQLLEMVSVAGHGTGKIDTDDLKAMALMLPSSEEQQRIASCLSSLDALITAETKGLEALKTHKKGLMQQLFPSMGCDEP
jgi:type I restriction enzyme S subunit